jgi:hypothetical protein
MAALGPSHMFTRLCRGARGILSLEGVAMKTLLNVALLVSVSLAAFYSRRAVAADLPTHDSGAPVVVELFTSEGCSSCPPADALLEKLDSAQPIPGAQAIVLSEHVDYWDHDGWKDSHSSRLFTERQEEYDRRFGLKSTFTPQMVVDGATQMNGSNGPQVARAIENASAVSRAKIPVRISSVSVVNENTLRVHLEVDALPTDFKSRKAEIFVAVALNHAESHVSGGENKGRDISHVAVAESIDKVGTVDKAKNFDRDVQVKVKSADLANLRLIAFVQEPDAGQIVGASLVASPIH